jgi:glutathione S-transferase
VLEKHLAQDNKEYLVGNKCTIADIANWGWVTSADWSGVDLGEFPNLKAWDDRMLARPAVEKGRHVPSRHHLKDIANDEKETAKYASEVSGWVREGMEKDAKK